MSDDNSGSVNIVSGSDKEVSGNITIETGIVIYETKWQKRYAHFPVKVDNKLTWLKEYYVKVRYHETYNFDIQDVEDSWEVIEKTLNPTQYILFGAK